MALVQRGPVVLSGATADLPSAGEAGRIFYDTDVNLHFFDDGTNWQPIGEQQTLCWGGRTASGTSTERGLVANGDNAVGTRGATDDLTRHVALFTGVITRLMVYVQEAGTDTLDQVQIYVNEVSVYDSGTGLGLTDQQNHAAVPGDAVSEGDNLIVTCVKSGTNATMDFLAYIIITRTA